MKNIVKSLITVAALVAMQTANAANIYFPANTPLGVQALTMALATRCQNSVNSFGRGGVYVSVRVRDAGYADNGGHAFISSMSYEGVQGDMNCGEVVIVDNQGSIQWGYGSGNGNWGVTLKDASKNFIPYRDVEELIDQMNLRASKLD